MSVDNCVASYFRASTAIGWRRWLFRPYADINNIFDERCNSNIRINAFGSHYYEPVPGRNFYAGIYVRYRFSER